MQTLQNAKTLTRESAHENASLLVPLGSNAKSNF
jgi:hypothetical protein